MTNVMWEAQIRAAEPVQSHKPACFQFIPEDQAALLGSLLLLDSVTVLDFYRSLFKE